MAKRPSESDTELPRKRVRFGDAGTPLRSEASPVARRRLQLKQLSPRHVRMKQVKCSPLRRAIKSGVTVLKLTKAVDEPLIAPEPCYLSPQGKYM